MMSTRISSIASGLLVVAVSLLSACQYSDGKYDSVSPSGQPVFYPLDSKLIIDVEESFAGKNRSLILTGITTREYKTPYFYVDAEVSLQPAWMTVSIIGVRYKDNDSDYIQGGAEFGVPIDKTLTGGDSPPLEGSSFRLDVRYEDRVDTYAARISSDTVTVTPVHSAGLSEVRNPTWKRTPEELLWYYAIQFSSMSGYLGEVSPATVQPLNDYLVSAGAQAWLLPAGYYKNLRLTIDDRGVALHSNLANPHQPLHLSYTFRYTGDRVALAEQLNRVQFPAPEPWIYYLNPY